MRVASWSGAPQYAPPGWALYATWRALFPALPEGAQVILPHGAPSCAAVGRPQALPPYGYAGERGYLKVSWRGQSVYTPPYAAAHVTWEVQQQPPALLPEGAQVILPHGAPSCAAVGRPQALPPYGYAGERGYLKVSWAGTGEQALPSSPLLASWARLKWGGEDASVLLSGWEDGAMGTEASIRNCAELVSARGWQSAGGVGAPLLVWQQFIDTDGRVYERFGNTRIKNRADAIRPSSIPAAFLGADAKFGADVAIRFTNRRMTAEGWQDDKWAEASPPGVAPFVQWSRGTFVSHFLRRIHARDDFLSERFGASRIEYNPQPVLPAGIAPGFVGVPGLSDHNDIFADGWLDTRWGESVRPPYQDVPPGGWHYTEYGNASVESSIRSVQPDDTGKMARYGIPTVWPWQQYIETDSTSETSGLRPDEGTGERSRNWGRAVVHARNRAIYPYGYPQARFGYTYINQGARALLPAGIAPPDAAPPVLPPHRVAHWRQVVRVDEPVRGALVSSWAVVWNKARPLRPAGWGSAAWGAPALTKLRQYITRAGGLDSAEMGAGGMVAPRIRHIVLDAWNSISPPYNAGHIIELLSRAVQPPSICNFNSALGRVVDRFGTPDVVERFTIIRPRWGDGLKTDAFGVETRIKNVTPEVRTRGKRADEWGDTHIRTEWREVQVWGSTHTVFGGARIADRRQWVRQASVRNTPAVGWHTVTKVGIDPPWTQTIDLRKYRFDTQQGKFVEEKEGFGIAPPPPSQHVPRPTVIGVSAWPEGWADTRFGSADVWFGGIRVEPGIAHFPFGEHAVTLGRRTIAPESLGQQVEDGVSYSARGSFGYARLSPHTIYAVLEAPPQAKNNHQGHQYILPVNAGETFGSATVGGYVGTIWPRGIQHGGSQNPWGVAQVELLRRYLRPEGWRSQRFGWHSLPCDQHIIFDDEDYALPQEAWGRASVSFPPEFHRTVRAGGDDFFACGAGEDGKDAHEIQNFHRELLPRGWDSRQMGDSGRHDVPFMPQRLRVSHQAEYWPKMQGFDVAKWGKAWVSLRVREVLPWGWLDEDLGYTLEQFEHRLRVRRTGDAPVTPQPQPGAAQTIWPHGWAHDARFGVPDAQRRLHRIRAGVICPPTNQVSILAEVHHAA